MANFVLWGVLLPPLLGFIFLGLVGKAFSRATIAAIGCGLCGVSFLFTMFNFISMVGTPAAARSNDQVVYTWLVSGTGTNPLQINFGLLVDPLTITWLLIITGVGLLIHIYSAGYMEEDPGFWRFFSY